MSCEQQQQQDEIETAPAAPNDNEDENSTMTTDDDRLNPKTIHQFLSEFIPDGDSDDEFLQALAFVKKYVGVSEEEQSSSVCSSNLSSDDESEKSSSSSSSASSSSTSSNSEEEEETPIPDSNNITTRNVPHHCSSDESNKSSSSVSSSSTSSSNSREEEETPFTTGNNITTRNVPSHRNNNSNNDDDDSSTDTISRLIEDRANNIAPSDTPIDEPSEAPRTDPVGEIVNSEDDAKKIFKNLGSKVKRHAIDLLSLHVHEEHRRNVQARELVRWLQEPNPIRNYLFYKSAGLRALVQAKGIVLQNGKKKNDDMIQALAEGRRPQQVPDTITTTMGGQQGTNHEQEAKDSATKAILQKSFLPHQKGKAREHCSLGHRLELPILNSWLSIVDQEDEYAPGIEVKGAYTAGLAAKKGAEFAKDSIDFIITIKDNDNGGLVKAWGFEAKGRVTAATAAEEELNLHYLNNPHVRIQDIDVHWEVANEGERFQLLQHAYVYDLDTVVLAISDNMSSLIRSSIVDFTFELKDHFGNVLKVLKDISLSWAYPTSAQQQQVNTSTYNQRQQKILHIPERIFRIADEIKTINDRWFFW